MKYLKNRDSSYKLDANGDRIKWIRKTYPKKADRFAGIKLGTLPGDCLVNAHGQLILDELTMHADEKDFVSAEALKGLRTPEFEAMLKQAAPSNSSANNIVSGWMTTFRKVGFIEDVREAKPAKATRGPNAAIGKKLEPRIRTKAEIEEQRKGMQAYYASLRGEKVAE